MNGSLSSASLYDVMVLDSWFDISVAALTLFHLFSIHFLNALAVSVRVEVEDSSSLWPVRRLSSKELILFMDFSNNASSLSSTLAATMLIALLMGNLLPALSCSSSTKAWSDK